MHFVNCIRVPQQAKTRFVVKSATLILFSDFLLYFGFHGQIAKTLYCSKFYHTLYFIRCFGNSSVPNFGGDTRRKTTKKQIEKLSK